MAWKVETKSIAARVALATPANADSSITSEAGVRNDAWLSRLAGVPK
jgi:hypothetical protein